MHTRCLDVRDREEHPVSRFIIGGVLVPLLYGLTVADAAYSRD